MFCKKKNKFTNSHVTGNKYAGKTDIFAIGHYRLILFEDVYVFPATT